MALQNIYCLQYNNYFNRIVKKEATMSEYQPYVVYQLSRVSFNPNDGVNTTQVINTEVKCDYFIVTDLTGTEIDSRWFVVESRRERNGQYTLTLYRDLFVDYETAIKQSKCFVQKGYVPETSPFIFNNENMGFNQIKKSETLLTNRLNTPWIVAYLSRYNGEGAYNTFQGTFKPSPIENIDYNVTSLSDYAYYQAGQGYVYIDYNPKFYTYYKVQGRASYFVTACDPNTIGTTQQDSETTVNYPVAQKPVDVENPYAAIRVKYDAGDVITNGVPINSYTGFGNISGYEQLTAENGKTIKTSDGKTYRITVKYSGYTAGANAIQTKIDASSALGIEAKNNFFPADNQLTGDIWLYVYYWQHLSQVKFEYIEISADELAYNFTYDGAVTGDAIYEIIATPYKNVNFTIDAEGRQVLHDGNLALNWFQDIANRYKASGYCMDVQIVPYVNVDTTDITNQNKIYCTRGGVNKNVCVGIKLTASSFTVSNTVNIPLRDSKKIGNECDLFRLCSPNGIGNFDFNPYKNDGFSAFEADVTLLPINPYIKIHPFWSGLYGNGSIEDFRGLICGGDFSIGNTSNEWLTYQQQNKYYQDIFNRQIESQEINNDIARERERWDVGFGAIQGAVSGGIGGAMVGGGIGAGIGALVGGGASVLGGLKDIEFNERQRSEAIRLQKDMFGYQLGTVKARTTQLSKTTAFNINNKYFPYVEYWTCTEEEVEALKNKIKYNGMTIGVIGTLGDYLDIKGETFIQAQVIEIDVNDDTHLANAIATNLAEGVRM